MVYVREVPCGYWQVGGHGLCLPAPCRRHRWEQEKLDARKMPENSDESFLFSARFVGGLFRVR